METKEKLKTVKLTDSDLGVLTQALSRVDALLGKDIKELTAAGRWVDVRGARSQRTALRKVASKVLS